MQKRVLAFLLVLTLVFSLLPVALVAAEEETVAPGYVIGLQKAHNQPDEGVAVDIYLQATTDTQADVTGYQFTVVPAEGLTLTLPDTHTDGNLSAGGTDNVFVYSPAQTDAGFAVGTKRVRIATINLSGTTTAADAISLADVTVTTGTAGFYSDDAADATVENYLGAVTQTSVALNDAWADVTGEWTALDQATLDAIEETPSYKMKNNEYVLDEDGNKVVSYYYNVLPAGNYYLVEDISAPYQIVTAGTNLDLNGYNFGASGAHDLFKAQGGDLTVNDITATGSALDGTLVAGTIVAGNSSYGGALYADRASVITVSNVSIDASAVVGTDSGYLLYCLGENSKNTTGKIVVNNVHLFGGKASTAAEVPVIMAEARGDIEMNNVRFSDFDLTPNSAETNPDALTSADNALISARHGATVGSLVMNNVIAEGCNNYSALLKNTTNNTVDSFTIKGVTKLTDPVYVANVGTKVTLDLDEGAEVTIETAELLTAEEFSQIAAVVDTLPAGSLFYKNAEQYVTYKDGAFDFSAHAHDDVAFKVWRDADSLPTSGNYYLDTDVTLNCEDVIIPYGETLNLDLNGHTITQTKAKARVYWINGVLNLYDCAEEYAEDGTTWTGGVITGGTGSTGGTFRVGRSQPGKLDDADRPTFNMYGGRIAGNGGTNTASAAAVYVTASRNEDPAAADDTTVVGDAAYDERGGQFNMYGGELYDNHTTTIGGAVTVWGLGTTRSKDEDNSGVKERRAIADGLGAEFNMYDGKIHGNSSYKGGAIEVYNTDAVLNIYDGVIANNSADGRGGAIEAVNGCTVNIQGGLFQNNSATAQVYDMANTYVDEDNDGMLDYDEYTFYFGGSGGVIYMNGDCHLTINKATFDGNTAKDNNSQKWDNFGSGGAIALANNSNEVTITNSVFTNNEAYTKQTNGNTNGLGGAYYGYHANNVRISGCTFTGNSANRAGGAIAQRGGNSTTMRISDTKISGNEGNFCGAVYHVPNAPLYLHNTVITGNTTTTPDGGAVYLTNPSTRLVVSGKTIIADNIKTITSKTVKYTEEVTTETTDETTGETTTTTTYETKTRTLDLTGAADVYVQWQDNQKRKNLLEVNGLEKGSVINLFYPDYKQQTPNGTNLDGTTKYIITESGSVLHTSNLASDWVRVCDDEGSAQNSWSCGMVTAYDFDHPNGRNISRLADGTFTFDHIHTDAQGNQIQYTAVDALPTDFTGLTAHTDGTYYVYMSADKLDSTAAYNPTSSVTVCLNGKTIKSTGKVVQLANDGVTLTFEDCTEHFDAEGNYCAGTITSSATSSYGAGFRIHDGKVVLNGGRVADFKPTSSDIQGVAVYLSCTSTGATANSVGVPEFEMNGGYIGNFTVTHKSNVGTTGLAIYVRNTANDSTKGDVKLTMNGGIVGDITMTKNNHDSTPKAAGFNGVVNVTGTTSTIQNVDFKNINVTNNATSADGTSYGALNGGIIYMNTTSSEVKNCTFTDCNLTTGGAVSGGVVRMTNTNAYSLEDCTFTGCAVESTNTSIIGGIVNFSGTEGFTDCTFTDCSATTKTTLTGAMVNISGASDLVNITFTNCSANGGTGIWGGMINRSGTGKVTNCDVTGCTVETAKLVNGGIFRVFSAESVIENCDITKSSVTATTAVTGGIVHMSGATSNTLNNSTFDECTVTSDSAVTGGVLYHDDKIPTFTDTKFTNIEVTSHGDLKGGAIYVTRSGGALTITGCEFKNITAHNAGTTGNVLGGAIYNFCNGNNNISNNTFSYCSATAAGSREAYGGAFYSHEARSVATFNNNKFDHCSAKHSGGAIYLRKATMYAENLEIRNCSALSGAAMVVWFGADATLKNPTIENNHTTNYRYGAVEVGHNSSDDATLILSGKVVIDGNTGGSAKVPSNVGLREQSTSHIVIGSDGLLADSSIGVTAVNSRLTKGIFDITTDLGDVDPSAYFHSDRDDYVIAKLNGTAPVVTTTGTAAPTTADEGAVTEAAVVEAEAKVTSGEYIDIWTSSVTIDDVKYRYLTAYATMGTETANRLYFVNSEVDGTYYSVAQDAVNAAQGTESVVKLLGNNSEELSATGNVKIDLNGKAANTIEMAADTTLTLIDSTTNDYDCADGYGTITMTGDGSYETSVVHTDANGLLRRYAVIADAETGELSAHRVYLAITTKTLRPSNVGIGFKAVFAGDQYVTENLESFGLELSWFENFIDPETGDRSVAGARFTNMTAGPGEGDEYGKPNMKTVVISDILTKDETAGTVNIDNYNVDLNGIPYITVGGVTVYGNAVSVNMKDMSDKALANGTDEAKAMVAEMKTTFGITE